MEIAKKLRVLGSFLHENCRNVLFQTCANSGRCYGNERLLNIELKIFFVLKMSSLNISESFKPVAKGVL